MEHVSLAQLSQPPADPAAVDQPVPESGRIELTSFEAADDGESPPALPKLPPHALLAQTTDNRLRTTDTPDELPPVPRPLADDEDAAPETPIERPRNGRLEDPVGDRAWATDAAGLRLEDVILSIYEDYPLLHASFQQRNIVYGQELTAFGAFDLLTTASSINQPLGFYQNYRHAITATQPVYHGGEVFGGYRIGRGLFEPWYKERETDKGGEFRAGIRTPWGQNHRIDERRAGLWQATWERQRVEPAIQIDLINFVRLGGYAYWEWVAAGQTLEISRALLRIAEERVEGLQRQVEAGEIAEIELVDNERLIVSREALVIEARQRVQQAAVNLSLFLRTPDGHPYVPSEQQLPKTFPAPLEIDTAKIDADVERALLNRPEMRHLMFLRRQVEVDLEQARNLFLPALDTMLVASQDVGEPATVLRDKSRFELEAAVFLTVPLQRRVARGRIWQAEGRLAELAAQQRFAQDGIVTDVQNAYIALQRNYERIERARESVELARRMEEAERRLFAEGQSNLLLVNLREQQTADAALLEVQALFAWFRADADYRAALALDVVADPVPLPDLAPIPPPPLGPAPRKH